MNTPKPAHPAQLSATNKTVPFPYRDQNGAVRKLERLVILEGEIRALPSPAAVALHAVNEPRDLLEFGHACLFKRSGSGMLRLQSASSVGEVDANAPLVRGLARMAKLYVKSGKPALMDLTPVAAEYGYPFKFGLLVPLNDRKGSASAYLLFASPQAWPPARQQIAERISGAYAQALRALSPRFEPALFSSRIFDAILGLDVGFAGNGGIEFPSSQSHRACAI